MRSKFGFAALIAITAIGLSACGGKEPPPPPPVVNETTAVPDADSLAAAELARMEAAASQMCADARTAIANGDYERAKRLLEQVQRDYPGTECADSAGMLAAGVESVMVVRERIHFEFDRSRITDEAATILQRKADVLRNYPNLSVTIEGHADERGSLEYNQALGQRRAEAARSYLVNLGLSNGMFRTISYGEERPIAQGSNESAWAENRRDEFVLPNAAALLQ
ncbi:MAG: peptidoglycan-associated lipoprotein Pal [Gemmatimonadota bacterium]|jgi:peptidoglycan-associated lipoprotein